MHITDMNKKNVNKLTFEEHFSELKRRITIIVVSFIIIFALCLWKSNEILKLFIKQGKEIGYTMIALSPQETLLQQFRSSFICGLFITTPIIIYEIVLFILPAIDKKKLRFFSLSIIVSCFLFALGMIFTIYLLFPFILKYMKGITFASEILLEISIESYISFFLTLIIIIGFVFEIPIISLFLSSIGIISSKQMKKYQKVVIIMILILAAIITPPDVVSQIIVAIPMIILYEMSIVLCRLAERKHNKKTEV